MALGKFSLVFGKDDSRQKQKRFMKHHLGKPKAMSVQHFYTQMLKLNRCILYLPGIGDVFPPDEL